MYGTGTIVTDKDIHMIVKILQGDPTLIRDAERFCRGLELHEADLEMFRRSSRDPNEILPWALCTWMSREGDNATYENLTAILKDENFNRTAQLIVQESRKSRGLPGEEIANNNIDTDDVWFEVPGPFRDFAGRSKDMLRLHDSVSHQALDYITLITTKGQMTTIVSGLGGIGKTTLAMHYAWTYKESGIYSNVIWINSETFTAMKASLSRLVVHLKLKTNGSNPQDSEATKLMKLIYERFKGQNKTLFIFDNVEDYESINAYLPVIKPNVRNPFILLTSRKRISNDKIDRIELNVFEEEESVEFFTKYLTLKTDEERVCAKEISTMLHHLPLAIRQAGAYIRTQRENLNTSNKIEMRKYVNLFEENSKKLLGYEYSNRTNDIYEHTTLTTWNVTMDKIKEQNWLSVHLMNLMSYMTPDNIPNFFFGYIDYEYFENLSRRPEITSNAVLNTHRVVFGMNLIEDAISLLSEYSMISIQESNTSVHRLVQHVIRQQQVDEAYLYDCIKLVKSNLAADSDDNVCLLQGESVVANIKKAGCQNKHRRFIRLIEDKLNSALNQQIQQIRDSFKFGWFDEAYRLIQECRHRWRKSPSSYKAFLKMSVKLLSEVSNLESIEENQAACKAMADDIISSFKESSDLVVEFLVPGASGYFFNYIFENYQTEFEQIMQSAYSEIKTNSQQGRLWENVDVTFSMVHYLFIGFRILLNTDECIDVTRALNSYFSVVHVPHTEDYVHYLDPFRRNIFKIIQRPDLDMELKSKLTLELLNLSVAIHTRFVEACLNQEVSASEVAWTVIYCQIQMNRQDEILDFVQTHLTCVENACKINNNSMISLSSLLEFSEMMLTHGRDGQNIKYLSLIDGSKLAIETFYKISNVHTHTQANEYLTVDYKSNSMRALSVLTNVRLLLKLGIDSNSFRDALNSMSEKVPGVNDSIRRYRRENLKKPQRIFYDIANDLIEFGFSTEALVNLELLEECIMDYMDLNDIETLIDTMRLISKINVERGSFEIALAKLIEASGLLIENLNYGNQSELNQIIKNEMHEIEQMINQFSKNENNDKTNSVTLKENEIVTRCRIL